MSDKVQPEAGSRAFTRSRAIRMKCLDCSAGQQTEVRKCAITDCCLYPYRMGSRNDKDVWALYTGPTNQSEIK